MVDGIESFCSNGDFWSYVYWQMEYYFFCGVFVVFFCGFFVNYCVFLVYVFG